MSSQENYLLQSISKGNSNQNDHRLENLTEWLSSLFPKFSILPLSGDASFRRYFRVSTEVDSFIVMDAPPDKENCSAFVTIAKAFENSSLRFPKIFAMDHTLGFLLLSDFGDRQLLSVLNKNSANDLYVSAMNILFQMQRDNSTLKINFHLFDSAAFWGEFEIFNTWYLEKNVNLVLSADQKIQLKNTYEWLIESALSQPTVFVHRDYHSRNIMICHDHQMGILDFQDALMGPITYDLVSLLRDCYIAWPEDKIQQWVFFFYQKLINSRQISVDFATFMRWFDLMGLQRHIKCLGIFSRLYFRDQKSGYLKDIPRVLCYAVSVCEKYPELSGIGNLLKNKTGP